MTLHRSDSIRDDSVTTDRVVTHVISSATVDSYGTILRPEGCDYSDFLRNPIVLSDHCYSTRAVIGRCLGVELRDGLLVARTEFAPRPTEHVGEWWPDSLLSLYRDRFLRAWSVGFDVVEVSPPTEAERKSGADVVFSKWRLVEYSAVGVPANPDALTLTRARSAVESGLADAGLLEWVRSRQPRTVLLWPTASERRAAVAKRVERAVESAFRSEVKRLRGRVEVE